jgi:TP901 family phage tail tape measure protein
MGFDAGQVKGKLSFDTSSFSKAEKTIKKGQAGITKSTKTAGGAFKGMWKQVAAGVGVTQVVTSGIRMIKDQISDVIQKGREFETEWANVTTMISDTSVNTEELRDELLNLSPTLGSTTELAKGMYQVLSASIEPAKAIEFLGEAAKSAKAGVTDTATAVDALTTVINAYGMEAGQVTNVSDVMFQTVKRGKLTYEELSTSLGTVVPIAANLGVEFTEVGAAMASLTRQGIDAATATMQMRQVLMSILTPSKEAAELAEALGIEMGAGALKTKGFVGWLKEMKEKTGGSADAMGKLVPNARALTAVMALAGERIGEVTDDLDLMSEAWTTGGQTQEAFTKQMQTASFWMDAGKEAVDKFKISFYLGLVEPFKAGITTADDLDKTTKELTQTFRDLGEAIGFVLKAAADTLGKRIKNWTRDFKFATWATKAFSNALKGQKREIKTSAEDYKNFFQDVKNLAQAEYEAKEATKGATDANKDSKDQANATASAWDELQKTIGKTKEELTAYEQFIKDSAIMTVAEKSKKVGELTDILAKLHQEYKDGKLDYQTYMNAVDQVKGKIAELSTTIAETAVPAARDLSNALAEAPGEVSQNTQTAIIEVGKGASDITELFGQVSERIRDKWTTELGAMLSGATSFKDGMSSIWTTMKQQFFDLLAQMLTKFTLSFVSGILSGAAKAGQGIIGSIGGAISGILGGGGQAGAGGTGGIGGLLGGLGGSSPVGAIAMGVGGLLGGLLSGGGDKHYLSGIKDNTWAIMMDMRNAVTNQDFLKSRADWTHGELVTVNAQLNAIKLSNWDISKETGKMKNTLWRIERIFENVKGAASGYVSTDEELVFTHGTPTNPEYVIPHDAIEDIINLSALYGETTDRPQDGPGGTQPGGGGGGASSPGIVMNFDIDVNLLGKMVTDTEHTREIIIPEIIAAFEANIRKIDFVEALDLNS